MEFSIGKSWKLYKINLFSRKMWNKGVEHFQADNLLTYLKIITERRVDFIENRKIFHNIASESRKSDFLTSEFISQRP